MNLLSIVGLLVLITGIIWFWQIFFKGNVQVNLTINSKEDKSQNKPLSEKNQASSLKSTTVSDLIGSVSQSSQSSVGKSDDVSKADQPITDNVTVSTVIPYSSDPLADISGAGPVTSEMEETDNPQLEPSEDAYIKFVYDEADSSENSDEDDDELPSLDYG